MVLNPTMSEIPPINDNNTGLNLLCDNSMDMDNVPVIKSSGNRKLGDQ